MCVFILSEVIQQYRVHLERQTPLATPLVCSFVSVCSICVRPTFVIKLYSDVIAPTWHLLLRNSSYVCSRRAVNGMLIHFEWSLWHHMFGSLISKSLVCKVHGHILNRAWCVYSISWFYIIDGQYLSPSSTAYRFSFVVWTASCVRKLNRESVQRNTKPR